LSSGSIGRFEATAFAADNTPVVRGSSVPFLMNGIDGMSLPLFVGKTGTWARPPDVLRSPHQHPALAVVLHAYLVAAGGESLAGSDPTRDDVYDVSTWSTLQSQPAFPRAPRSMVAVGTAVLLVDEAGATWLDLYNGSANAGAAPEGLTFPEVAGGEVFAAPDGRVQYLVGATRASGPETNKVLRVDSGDLSLHALSLTTPRAGAAAAVVGGQLIVAGGSADPTSAGVEALQPDCGNKMECFRPVMFFPADATAGAGMVEGLAVPASALDAGTTAPGDGVDAGAVDPDADGAGAGSITPGPGMNVAFLAGGVSAGSPQGIRRLDLSCATPSAITSASPPPCANRNIAPLPVALARTHVFILRPTQLFIVGEADDGENRALGLDLISMAIDMPVPRERRKGASVALFPNGQTGLVGGVSVDTGQPVTTIELFINR
jgi:hypothetical protein